VFLLCLVSGPKRWAPDPRSSHWLTACESQDAFVTDLPAAAFSSC